MAKRAADSLDKGLLSHHPAGQTCVDVCLANGWQPQSKDVVRLVQLWEEVHQGRRSEVSLSPAHLGFARWLIEHGRLSEDVEGEDQAA